MSRAKQRVLALVHRHLVPPDTVPEGTDLVSAPWRTEYDVISTLRALGHEVEVLGVQDDLGALRRASAEWHPSIAFNLLDISKVIRRRFRSLRTSCHSDQITSHCGAGWQSNVT